MNWQPFNNHTLENFDIVKFQDNSYGVVLGDLIESTQWSVDVQDVQPSGTVIHEDGSTYDQIIMIAKFQTHEH